MKRNITTHLLHWQKQPNRKPLIVRGARQVGKSHSIIDYGENHFPGKVHVVNLERQPDWHQIFEPNLDPNRILLELEIVLNTRIEVGKDLLFFDEIQACPKAIVALRYFYEQVPDLHVIAAGSLLEFALRDISFPVGRVQLINMYPMTFAEFLGARDKGRLTELMTTAKEPLPPSLHAVLRRELRLYFVIGGMPESVKTFIATDKMQDVYKVQSDLLETFRQDFSKYTPHADPRCLNDVLFSISRSIGQQVKYAALSDGFSNPTIKKSFNLLATARMLYKVRSASPAGLPLQAGASEKKFKAILLDIGLLARLSGLSIKDEYVQDNLLSMFKGALAEQFVGQELLAAGDGALFYWARSAKSSSAEVDYLSVRDEEIIPIEVKSSSAGRLRSLHLLLETYPNVTHGYVLSDGKQGTIEEQRLSFLPLYWASKLTGQA